MSLRGLILRLAYRLRRHRFGGWTLGRWLGGLLLLAIALLLAVAGRAAWPAAVVLAVLFLAYVAALMWAAHNNYYYFEPDSLPAVSPAGLGPQDVVPTRASGRFEVQGKEQTFVDLDADYQTVPSREHTILARVYPSRFLLLGAWPGHEIGWWYAFFRPAMLRRVQAGRLHFGARPRLAVRVVYQASREQSDAVYLAFDGPAELERVLADLSLDAPPGVI